MRVLIGVALLAGVVSCRSDSSGPTPVSTNKAYDVYALTTAFSPVTLTIGVNDTIRWNFAASSDGHNVRFDSAVPGAPAEIPVTKTATTVRTVFAARGTFAYVCDVHPGMSGEVIVK